jgi:hypothetical protein
MGLSLALGSALLVSACSGGNESTSGTAQADALASSQVEAPAVFDLCTRAELQQAVDLYIDAQTKGDLSGLPLAQGVGYQENMKPADIRKGFVTKPLKIDFHRSFLDPSTCQTFTEIIVTDKAAPYVAAARLRWNRDKIVEVETLWTTTGYWLFNAEAYLKYSSGENWDPIPADRRDTRGTLVAAANAYLDAFLEKKIDKVPWGFPCVRIEGGAYTGKGEPTDSCEVGVPGGVNIANRRFVVDEELGTVAVFCTFGAGGPEGGSGAPDTHLFRVENGHAPSAVCVPRQHRERWQAAGELRDR